MQIFMYKIIFFTTVSLFSFFQSLGQSKIKGIILDSLSQEPIPFVHILAKEGEVTISNENGHFLITKNIGVTTFSVIGYEQKEIKLSDNNVTVFLNPEIYLLPDVKVLPQKTSVIEIGNIKKIRGNQIKTSMTSKGSGYKIVKFMENEKQIGGEIKTVSFYVVDKAKFNQRIRLLLFLPDSVTQKPGSNLLPKSIIVSLGKKKKWQEIDIANLHIPIPPNGFFVGLEFLPILDLGRIPVQDKLNVGLINKENKQFTWMKRIDGEWGISNFLKTYDGRIANLMVKMKIESSLSKMKRMNPN